MNTNMSQAGASFGVSFDVSKTMGLHNINPQAFEQVGKHHHRVVSIKTVGESLIKVATECGISKTHPKSLSQSCKAGEMIFQVKKNGFDLLGATFKHNNLCVNILETKAESRVGEICSKRSENFSLKCYQSLYNANNDAVNTCNKAVEDRKREERGDGDIVDTPHKFISADKNVKKCGEVLKMFQSVLNPETN